MATIEAYLNKIFCMDAIALMRELPDASVDLVLTDPPYAVLGGTIGDTWDKKIDFAAFWQQVERIITPTGVIAICASMPFSALLVCSNLKLFRYEWTVVKNIATDFLNANHRPLRAHESVQIFSKGKSVGGANGGKEFMAYYPQFENGAAYYKKNMKGYTGYNNVVRIDTDNDGFRYPKSALYSVMKNDDKVHPTQKSVEIFEYLIKTYTLPDQIVLDCYIGSGTTAVAARNTGRHFIGCDLSPEYIALANERLRLPFTPRAVTPVNNVSDLPLFRAALDAR